MKAGDLDQRVTFLRPVHVSDGAGGNTVTWQEVCTVAANVRAMTGREREHADRLNSQANYVIGIRNRTDIDETCTAEWKGVTFNVRFVPIMPRENFISVEVEKGVAV